jgi:hypothetical protein
MVVPPNIESMRFNQLGFAEDVFLFSPWEIHYLGNL